VKSGRGTAGICGTEGSSRPVSAKKGKYGLSRCVPSARRVAAGEIWKAAVRKTCDISTFFWLRRPHCNTHRYGNTLGTYFPLGFSEIIKAALTGDRPQSPILKDE